MSCLPKTKLLRVVTVHECVLWHLGKTLSGLSEVFDLTVAGEGVSRYKIRYPEITWVDIDISREVAPYRDLKALLQIYKICRKIQPEIVHSIMPKAGLLTAIAALFSGVPIRMHTFTGQVWESKTGFFRWLYKTLDRLVVILNSACLTDSPSQSEYLFSHGISLYGRPLPVLGSGSLVGVDLERFDPVRISNTSKLTRESLGLNGEHFLVAYIARKSRDKGAIDMLMGFNLVKYKKPHMRLLFIGPDESQGEIESLRKLVPSIFESVIEIGAVSNHEEYLYVSDLLCMPSYREGFGSVVIDAAALGVPSIGSRIVGLVDSISDGVTGVLHPPGDITGLALLLTRLDEDRSLLLSLGRNARARTQDNFSSETMCQLIIDFYRAQIALT